MRIIGGRWRGLTLAEVGAGDPAAHLRPTSDRVREAIFNLLINGSHGDRVTGATVLDLFAGTGALGLEALSRGALTVTLVDDGRAARRLIGQNIAKMRAEAQVSLMARDAIRLPPAPAPCTLIFLDPPYGKELGGPALASALEQGWIAPAATVLWEEAAPVAAPQGFALLDQRRYGDTWVTLLERAP
ncbi:16S rRNA (guanine(966)-N(2))-methyltransferase RsmD [bacterium]|nr:16S rRNA (guanine(966)-N(2))-methyltransferase RsmD [bacterium]